MEMTTLEKEHEKAPINDDVNTNDNELTTIKKSQVKKKRKSNEILDGDICNNQTITEKFIDKIETEIKEKTSKIAKKVKKSNEEPAEKVKKKREKKEKEKEKEEDTQEEPKKKKDKKEKEKEKEEEGVQQEEPKKKKEKKEDKVSKVKKEKDASPKRISVTDESKKTILDYMIAQNRPYSLLNIFDNLHGQIKKGQLQKYLDALSDENQLIRKEYNSTIYLASQSHFESIDENALTALDQEIECTKATITGQKDENSELQSQLKSILQTYSEEELAEQIRINRKIVSDLGGRLHKLEDKNVTLIPEETMLQAEKEYEKQKVMFKKVKKVCMDIVSQLSDGMEMKTQQFMELLNLEGDGDFIASLKQKI